MPVVWFHQTEKRCAFRWYETTGTRLRQTSSRTREEESLQAITSSMHILQVTIYGEMKFGGPPQKIFALGEGLAKRGHSVEIAAFHSEHPEGCPREERGRDGQRVGVHFLPWMGRALWQLPRDWRRLRRLVRRADVVHLYGIYNLLCPLAAWMARREGKPFLLEPVGMWVPRSNNLRAKKIYNRLFTTPMARGAARVVATSAREADEMGDLAPPSKLVLRRNGLDLSPFQHLPDGKVFRARFGISPDERLVVFVGRISPIKNLEELVRAFSLADLRRARLLLVGPELEPAYAAQLRALIEELNLTRKIVFAGELYGDDKLAALSGADLFVLPSTYESYGNAAAEAVAAGVPVLISNGCGLAPQIHERAGLSVSPDGRALADGLRILLDDREKLSSCTARRAEVVRELSWDEPLDLTEQIYRALLAESAR